MRTGLRWIVGAALLAAASSMVASRLLDRPDGAVSTLEFEQSLHGTWLGIEKVENGLLLPPHRARTTEIRIEGSQFTVLEAGESPVVGTFQILSDRDPPGLKIVVDSPESMTGTEIRANFRVDGDVLTLVTNETRSWPQDLSAEYGTMQHRTVLRRMSPSPPPAP